MPKTMIKSPGRWYLLHVSASRRHNAEPGFIPTIGPTLYMGGTAEPQPYRHRISVGFGVGLWGRAFRVSFASNALLSINTPQCRGNDPEKLLQARRPGREGLTSGADSEVRVRR
jgi:hypothetical protein